tara:strand:- start:236 stop:976 length:741 start_codon:yes stop_codon:yes gene_type:complete
MNSYLGSTKLLTSPASSYKTAKGIARGYANYISYMKPYKTIVNGVERNVCSMAKTCIKPCLVSAGRGAFNSVKEARKKRTLYYWEDRKAFLEQMEKEINTGIKWAERKKLVPVFRLNGTSDLPFHRMGILQKFPSYQFYDYTKVYNRTTQKLPDNYHLTFSYDGTNLQQCITALNNGINVAMVFRDKLPTSYVLRDKKGRFVNGYKHIKVIDGDKHDLRFLDESPVIVGLSAKGEAKKDDSVFIID